MKKIFFFIAVIFSFSAKAQMIDTIGALGIQGELSTEGYRSINQGQQALSRMQFQQDLGELVSQIQTTYFGNYRGINKESVMFDGFRGLNWNVEEDGEGGFLVEVDGLDGGTCFICKGNLMGAKRTDINSGNDCVATNNKVKIFFN